MKIQFVRFGGWSALIVGVLSLLYALFYLVIARRAEYAGNLGSWTILAVSGIFSSAVYVALYQILKTKGGGFELWALVLGAAASLATLQHGTYEALLVRTMRFADGPTREAIDTARRLFSEVDPAGLSAFLLVGIATFLFSWLILRSGELPIGLGYLGIINAVLLAVLFFASANAMRTLILISGGLTSVVVGPAWWIWLGISLQRT
jgi:hypothetical protein